MTPAHTSMKFWLFRWIPLVGEKKESEEISTGEGKAVHCIKRYNDWNFTNVVRLGSGKWREGKAAHETIAQRRKKPALDHYDIKRHTFGINKHRNRRWRQRLGGTRTFPLLSVPMLVPLIVVSQGERRGWTEKKNNIMEIRRGRAARKKFNRSKERWQKKVFFLREDVWARVAEWEWITAKHKRTKECCVFWHKIHGMNSRGLLINFSVLDLKRILRASCKLSDYPSRRLCLQLATYRIGPEKRKKKSH